MSAYNLFEPLTSLDLSNWHVEISETYSSQCFAMHDNYLKKEKIITLKDKGTTVWIHKTAVSVMNSHIWLSSYLYICTVASLPGSI